MTGPTRPRSMNIMQWNCHSFRKHLTQIQTVSHKYDNILLCETFLKPLPSVSLRDFTINRNDRPYDHARETAICIRKNIPFKISPWISPVAWKVHPYMLTAMVNTYDNHQSINLHIPTLIETTESDSFIRSPSSTTTLLVETSIATILVGAAPTRAQLANLFSIISLLAVLLFWTTVPTHELTTLTATTPAASI